jgi:hypothetical protein
VRTEGRDVVSSLAVSGDVRTEGRGVLSSLAALGLTSRSSGGLPVSASFRGGEGTAFSILPEANSDLLILK